MIQLNNFVVINTERNKKHSLLKPVCRPLSLVLTPRHCRGTTAGHKTDCTVVFYSLIITRICKLCPKMSDEIMPELFNHVVFERNIDQWQTFIRYNKYKKKKMQVPSDFVFATHLAKLEKASEPLPECLGNNSKDIFTALISFRRCFSPQ